jgi:hypothetical protein
VAAASASRSRTILVPLAAAAAAGIVLLLPVSFEKTLGHDVVVTVSAPGLDGDHVTAVLHEIMWLTRASGLRVEADVSESGTAYRFVGSVGASAGAKAQRSLDALASVLREYGCEVTAGITPRQERVAGRVGGLLAARWAAFGADDAPVSKLEAEIRRHLVAAGFEQEQVSMPVPGPSQIRPSEATPAAPADTSSRPLPKIVLGEGVRSWTLVTREARDAAGARSLVVVLGKDGRSTAVQLSNVDAMSRSALAVALQQELERAGIDARVHVQSEGLSVELRR